MADPADHEYQTIFDNYAYCYYTLQNAYPFSLPVHHDNAPKKKRRRSSQSSGTTSCFGSTLSAGGKETTHKDLAEKDAEEITSPHAKMYPNQIRRRAPFADRV
jgi:hypothetical protein